MLTSNTRIALSIIIISIVFLDYKESCNYPSVQIFQNYTINKEKKVGNNIYPIGVPASLAFLSSGNIGITDINHEQLIIINCERDKACRVVSKIGRFGQSPGDFDFPSALEILPKNRIAILDQLNNRIQFFSSIKWSTPEIISTGIINPIGLAIFPDGMIYFGRNGSVYAGDPYSQIVCLQPNGVRGISWIVDKQILDVKPEIKGRLWVLCQNGLLLYTRSGKLLLRLPIPFIEDNPTSNLFKQSQKYIPNIIIKFHPAAFTQASDGSVYITSDNYILVYDKNYLPLARLSFEKLKYHILIGVLVDPIKRIMWFTDDRGMLFRLDLPDDLFRLHYS